MTNISLKLNQTVEWKKLDYQVVYKFYLFAYPNLTHSITLLDRNTKLFST